MSGNSSSVWHGVMRGCSLAAGLVLATSVAGRSIEKIKLSQQTMRVKGSSERRITSDWAVWRAQFDARSATLAGAYGKIRKDWDTVRCYFERNGVPTGAMAVSPVTTAIQYRKTDKGVAMNEIEGYVLEQAVEIKSGDIALIERLSRDSTSLIEEGIEFNSNPPQYFCMKANDLKIEMLGEAMKDARARAEQLARNSGSRVGALRSASQGVFQITPEYSTEVSDYGVYDTSSVEKTIKALVTVDFAIE